MKIAIASGKGGTGKTTVATSLAFAALEAGRTVVYLDCDVEEPNGHLFLRPEIDEQRLIDKPVPDVDATCCTHCGRCAHACRYGAIASLPDQTLIFSELCHSCGGCLLACPAEAIHERSRTIGQLRIGRSGRMRFLEGVLSVGEAMSPPVIRAVKSAAPTAEVTILDAPPGTSCPVIETLRGSDRVLLVTEPFAVVSHRADAGDRRVNDYCKANRIPVLAEIPDDRAGAEAYSRGQIIYQAVPSLHHRFTALLEHVQREERP